MVLRMWDIPGCEMSEKQGRAFLTFSNHLMQKPLINQGTLGSSRRKLKAVSSLEGGRASSLEGSSYFRIPCARVLSVAVFLAKRRLFPLAGGFILEVKRDTFLSGKPTLVDVGVKTVIPG